jgi:N-acetyl-gamma-glutamyl-phosphate reductase
MPQRVKVGIAGAAGYTGGELIRLLIYHPHVEIVFAHSKSNSGKAVSDMHTDLLGDTQLVFTNELNMNIDMLFLCMGHGQSSSFLEENSIPATIKIIDMSSDFRVKSEKNWIYGLPELNREEIKSSGYNIANPGCFATAIQLALLPLATAKLLKSEVHVNAITGSTGAGQSLSASSHFSWRNSNISTYKSFEHQHLAEITQSIQQTQNDFNDEINFIPTRGSFTRGIFATVYTECALTEAEALSLYEAYYASHPFVFVSHAPIDLKQVVNTNKCLLHIGVQGTKIVITSIIDNLLKGASGQGVQNMNLIFGLDETSGLKLKPSAF